MTNVGDIEYVSYIKVGGQQITGIIDTGSFELVVFSTECKTCGAAAKYNPMLSPDHRAGTLMTVQSYGSGDTYSWEASESVQIANFPSHNQSFWEVVDARMPILRNAAFQAIVGVGPPETPAADAWAEAQRALDSVNRYFTQGQQPPLDVAQNAKDSLDAALTMSENPTMLDNFGIKTFSVCMGAAPGSDGVFVWEDNLPFDMPNFFTKVPILGKHTWSVTLANVRLTRPGTFTENKLGCEGTKVCSALVDSGTSLLAVPSKIIKQIEEIIGNEKVEDCSDLSSFPNLVFEIGGKLLSLPPDSYIAQAVGNVSSHMQSFVRIRNFTWSEGRRANRKSCEVVLMESYMDSATGPLWIFGMPFFRKYYTSFHVGESHASRALYVAEATDECRPTEGASLARSRPHMRRIDVARVHVPPILRTVEKFVNL